MSPGETPPGASDTSRLRELGVPERALSELAELCDNPYRDVHRAAARLPLEDERHVRAWRLYLGEAERDGAAPTLVRRVLQLRFPVAEGTSQTPAFRGAILRAETPPPPPDDVFADPDGIVLELRETAAGPVPVVTARARADFDLLVRALTARCEPVPVPRAMGACLVRGLVNPDRVARHRERWEARRRESGLDVSATAWKSEMRRLAADKAAYQDRVLLLSSGPYSGVPASDVDLDEGEWRRQSLVLRRDHELFHYLTLRLAGSIRSHPLDELLADVAGLLGTDLPFRAATVLRLLGLRPDATLHDGARLPLYRGELSDRAFAALLPLVVQAAQHLEELVAARPDLAEPEGRPRLLLAAASLGLPSLAAPDALALLARRTAGPHPG